MQALDPWVGDQYGSSAFKPFILGHSHYSEKEEEVGADYTRSVVEEYAIEGKASFFTNIAQTFTGGHNSDRGWWETKRRFWQSAVFYNFVPGAPMKEPRSGLPPVAYYEEGARLFGPHIERLAPTHLFICSYELHSAMQQYLRMPDAVETKPPIGPKSTVMGVPFYVSEHPSTGYNSEKKNPKLVAHFRQIGLEEDYRAWLGNILPERTM